MSKHTAGPWVVVHEFNVYGPNNRLAANCGGRSSNVDSENVYLENCANARLIAAAPDLLEACKESINALLDYIPTLERNGDYMGYGRKVTKLLQSAIHKAEEGDA